MYTEITYDLMYETEHPWLKEGGEASDKPIDSAVQRRLKRFKDMNKLKKLALKVIAENLSEEEIKGLKQMFRNIDRIWGRQGCSFDEYGKGPCDTGDCGNKLHCQGLGGEPPATVVEMTLGSSTSPLHFYDVSLVDGFNLPVSMKPIGGGIGCGIAECEVDLNICCPSALEYREGEKVLGCKSACLAMQSAKYCCTGEYANPNTCKPTLFSHLFKAISPKAYSYAFDDSSSLNRCRASRYVITFCPPK